MKGYQRPALTRYPVPVLAGVFFVVLAMAGFGAAVLATIVGWIGMMIWVLVDGYRWGKQNL